MRLEPESLRPRCDPGRFEFATTAEVEPLEGMAGQARALDAIGFGLDVETRGYNIFAIGSAGTGRHTTLRARLAEHAAGRPAPPDLVHVLDFGDAERPLALRLDPGEGRRLADGMARLIDEARTALPRAFESERYQQRRREVADDVGERREVVLKELREFARARDLDLEVTPAGLVTLPVKDGERLTPPQFAALPEDVQLGFREHGKEVEERATEVMAGMRELERDAHARIRELDREVANFAVGHLVDEIKARHAEAPGVLSWLDRVREDVIENLRAFRSRDEEPAGLPPQLAVAAMSSQATFFARYEVNVLVGHDEDDTAPVVYETNPTFANLFGRIEYETTLGAVTTDHRHIRPGALHRASGGYLLLDAGELLGAPFVWRKLKEVLRRGSIQIENVGEQFMLFPTATLRPRAFEVDVKVVLVGPPWLHHMLHDHDEDVRKLFRVRAEFDVEMPWNEATTHEYAAFVAAQVRDNDLRHFGPGAVARLVEEGARHAGHRRRLSARFAEIADLVAEASHWAGRDGADVVEARHVDRAVAESIHRANLVEEKVRELIAEGTLLVAVEGERVGQVNGLSVSDVGGYAFGHPVRITAATSAGEDMVSIDRETELSGPLHDKGFLILSGFLRQRYGAAEVLSVAASLVFEQTYDEIEGDSASSAELYALLSSLSGAAIRQGIAVTGSVNQHGDVQPIGAVNEKVEGFFEVCRRVGLTGEQGVLIPATNVDHLVLRDDVVTAVAEGSFNVWAVRTIDEGIERLTGVPAGEPGPEGEYPPDSIHGRVADRLHELAEARRHMRGDDDDPG